MIGAALESRFGSALEIVQFGVVALVLLGAPGLPARVAAATELPQGSRVGAIHRDAEGHILSGEDPATAATNPPVPPAPPQPTASQPPPRAAAPIVKHPPTTSAAPPPREARAAEPVTITSNPEAWDAISCRWLGWQPGINQDACQRDLAAARRHHGAGVDQAVEQRENKAKPPAE